MEAAELMTHKNSVKSFNEETPLPLADEEIEIQGKSATRDKQKKKLMATECPHVNKLNFKKGLCETCYKKNLNS